MDSQINTYAVTATCGHVNLGIKGSYIPVSFVVQAVSRSAAADYSRQLPRVRHHKGNAILDVRQISDQEAEQIRVRNNADLFLKIRSRQEQEQLIPFSELIDRVCLPEKSCTSRHLSDSDAVFHCKVGKTCVRNLKKYLRMAPDCSVHVSFV